MPKAESTLLGEIYVMELFPPGRVKIGFTTNAANRLKEAQTWIPEAKLLASWPALKMWEAPVRDALIEGEAEGHEF